MCRGGPQWATLFFSSLGWATFFMLRQTAVTNLGSVSGNKITSYATSAAVVYTFIWAYQCVTAFYNVSSLQNRTHDCCETVALSALLPANFFAVDFPDSII